MSKIKTLLKKNFIHQIIDSDLFSGKYTSVRTRFPPEPNGYLHIGHAKSICLNFGIAQYYGGKCNLRIDDTNPVKENLEYIYSIQNDIKWLGFQWNGDVHYSSNYFSQLYDYALELINKGLAYVDQLSTDKIREYRGTLTCPGKNSPYRNRSVKENCELFNEMRLGKFAEGSACLRAKIDMGSPFIVMRDPVLYRVKFIDHHQTGNAWCIYPMYDFAHCISDALEDITHSLCTMEFQNNRRLYNWILNNISINSNPKQYEFSRLNLEYTIMSKRKLNLLVSKKIVEGWDDPRMPTISGLKRRGYTASSIREFCRRIGITRQDNNIKLSVLESCIREELNEHALRFMAVINPVLVVIESLAVGYEENILIQNHPSKLEMGTRYVIFSREIFIDRADFREKSNKQYKRLVLGQKVRLRHAYIIKADRIEKDDQQNIKTIFCRHYEKVSSQDDVKECKVKGVIHWVSATKSIPADFRMYEKLFIEANPAMSKDIFSIINPNSLIICQGFVEAGILKFDKQKQIQFEREGYFFADNHYFSNFHPVFNLIVKLRNTDTIK